MGRVRISNISTTLHKVEPQLHCTHRSQEENLFQFAEFSSEKSQLLHECSIGVRGQRTDKIASTTIPVGSSVPRLDAHTQ